MNLLVAAPDAGFLGGPVRGDVEDEQAGVVGQSDWSSAGPGGFEGAAEVCGDGGRGEFVVQPRLRLAARLPV